VGVSAEAAEAGNVMSTMFDSGNFPLYKEKYIIGYFGCKMMYLESNGWKRMPATADIFNLENWLVC
jgi:hypothetical protein